MTEQKPDDCEIIGPIYMMVDGKSIPVPEVLTESETIQLLRLDIEGPEDPGQTLAYYRDKGLLRATRIGKRLRYWKQEVLRFLACQTEETPRK